MEAVVFSTGGDGLWSDVSGAEVRITDMRIGYIDEEDLNFGELRVYFDTKTWDVNEQGLIYTDRLFLRQLREFLDQHGLVGKDVSYSEQGMQGDDYVSLDVGGPFLRSWAAKFNVNLQDVVKKQLEEFERRWGLTTKA